MNIVIIGGNGAMGRLFSSFWLSQGHDVVALDLFNWDQTEQILKKADLVIVSVPVSDTINVIQQISLYLLPKTILADFTSVKMDAINTMLNCHSGPVLGLHPMFGPTITTPQKQVIINCGGRSLDKSKWVLDSLLELGFKIVELSSIKHDEIMNFIQGLEHFNTFVLGGFLRKYDIQPQEIFSVSSPIYQAKLALMGRIFDQDAELYADIIMSDERRINLIEDYANYLTSWMIELKSYNKEKFIQSFEDTSLWMGSFTHESQVASDKFLSDVGQIYQENR